MSKSINLLLKNISSSGGKNQNQEDLNIHNPDIPKDNSALNDKKNVKDSYNNAFRLPSSGPRNGSGYVLQRGSNLRTPNNSKFYPDRSIDPNIIRSKVDPDSALPSLSSLSLHSLMPESVAPPHDRVSLVKKSHTSELNYKNRFKPSQQQPQQEEPPPAYQERNPDELIEDAREIKEFRANQEPPPEYPEDNYHKAPPKYGLN